MGKIRHCIQASRIVRMRFWAWDEALVNELCAAAAHAATEGDMRVSSSAGSSKGNAAMDSSDNCSGHAMPWQITVSYSYSELRLRAEGDLSS